MYIYIYTDHLALQSVASLRKIISRSMAELNDFLAVARQDYW